MILKPLFDNVVLTPYKLPAKQSGNLILETQDTEHAEIALVKEVGQEMLVKKNDLVLFNKYSGSEFIVDNQKYILIKQTDILAILNGVN